MLDEQDDTEAWNTEESSQYRSTLCWYIAGTRSSALPTYHQVAFNWYGYPYVAQDVLRYSFLVCMAQKDFACVCIIKVTMLVCITNTSRTVIHCILKFSQILIGPEIKQAERVFQEGTFAWDHARCIRRAGLRKLFH